MSRSAVPVLLAILLGAAGAGGDPVARVTQMNREALAAVDKREFEEAREIRKNALELCESAGVEQHPIAAMLGTLVEDVCFRNARAYFGFEVPSTCLKSTAIPAGPVHG